MNGWRGRLGIVVPCVNVTMEPEFNRLAAQVPGLSIHASRMHLVSTRETGLTQDALLKMEPLAVDVAVPELAHAGVGVIVYGCTSGSFAGGAGWDKKIVERIQEKTRAKATTTTTAIVAALKSLKVRKVALGTPYDEKVTQLGKAFLEHEGFQVVNTIALDNVYQICDAPPSAAYNLGRQVDVTTADCVFISCTQFPTLDALGPLEADLGKPVLSANLASFWHALQILQIKPRISGFGSLLQ